ncbi:MULTISPECIES: RagB/SusD family nutrient uptake outer membrane protein [Butyricimonas]|uniref:RagB/SusD family nutrient uptake outer membrane protein n=1 Tax=Butyricimonas TaxID=574697 RepID=UPI001D06BFA0|nr:MULTISPECIES: RagB/SusD family nutrient uptake outer membrane protein [Butyricimonas]MCB6973598.1 RagB/SusD family nutrient uptake outer membrane protein [Butyricimonas synergistica]MCG4520299.1 RagB/SusD family nutrient uptake outer membrane protein [Butyricimonas sp. DFI.6.44]
MMKQFCIILAIVLGLNSCTDLIDVQPENATTYTNYFQTRQDAEALLTELLLRLRNGESNRLGLGLIIDEDSRYQSMRNMATGLTADGSSVYRLIYQASLIIENAHRFQIPEEELKPYLLQAYFANAVGYWRLARDYGEMVILRSTTDFTPLAKSSQKELLDEAEKWALKAMDLPVYDELAGLDGPIIKNYGSKGAAAALLAHLYAWRAGVANEPEYWAKAEEYCTMIIDQKVGSYQLAINPESVVLDVMKGNNRENIWELENNAQESRYLTNNFVGFPIITSSGYAPVGGYSYGCKIHKTTVNNMYSRNDQRREAYFYGLDADFLYLKNVNGNIVADTSRKDGDDIVKSYDNKTIKQAFIYKFRYPYFHVTDNTPEPQYRGLNQNEIVWRLGGIYLLRAECRARQNKPDAVDDLNLIRRRAYGNMTASGGIVDAAKESEYAYPCAEDVEKGLANNIQLAIFREREKELFQENHRFYDIVRNGYCFLHDKDSYDYIRKELPAAFSYLTDKDIEDGALFSEVSSNFFTNNDLMRQNLFWNRYNQ